MTISNSSWFWFSKVVQCARLKIRFRLNHTTHWAQYSVTSDSSYYNCRKYSNLRIDIDRMCFSARVQWTLCTMWSLHSTASQSFLFFLGCPSHFRNICWYTSSRQSQHIASGSEKNMWVRLCSSESSITWCKNNNFYILQIAYIYNVGMQYAWMDSMPVYFIPPI